ncbi:MAG TPA: cysteine desulfurase family protein [Candidatus Paceibacterota bacterium]|nr:cysteine desulfurase family protein [Candidatus Paceibacterota bacterium]
MKKIYLDYAASTPVDPAVFEAMRPYFSEKFGNPGSLHSFGQEAIAVVDRSRETIAKAIGAEFREIIFTGSATEANNLALRGAVNNLRSQISDLKTPRIIISAIEHESVLETARDLEKDGIEVIYLPVDACGAVDMGKLKSSLNERTVLVSIMYANNEIGTIQPIKEIAEIVHGQRANGPTSQRARPLLHTDAVQAFQFLDCGVNALGVDLMTLSAHKIYGPKGIGALYRRIYDTCLPQAMVTGGGQEFGLRSGTENVPSIAGFAKTVELLRSPANSHELAGKKIAALRDRFWVELKKIYPKAEVNGQTANSNPQLANYRLPITDYRLPNILNVYFPDHLAEDLLAKLDLAGLAVSAGSACRSRAVESSYVLEALGYSKDRAKRSVRFSFGRPTTEGEIDRALGIVKESLTVTPRT